jgi:hypothetical protein
LSVSVVQSEHVFNPEVLLSAAGSGKNVARYGERTAVFQQGETGDGEQARQAFQQLIAGQPAWRQDAKGELRKLFPAPKLVDRLAGDLNAGLHTAN